MFRASDEFIRGRYSGKIAPINAIAFIYTIVAAYESRAAACSLYSCWMVSGTSTLQNDDRSVDPRVTDHVGEGCMHYERPRIRIWLTN